MNSAQYHLLSIYTSKASVIVLCNRSRREESLVEAARMLKSTAYKLHLVIEQNKVLQDLVAFFDFVGTVSEYKWSYSCFESSVLWEFLERYIFMIRD